MVPGEDKDEPIGGFAVGPSELVAMRALMFRMGALLRDTLAADDSVGQEVIAAAFSVAGGCHPTDELGRLSGTSPKAHPPDCIGVENATPEHIASFIASTPCAECDCPICGAERGQLCRNEKGDPCFGVCAGRIAEAGAPDSERLQLLTLQVRLARKLSYEVWEIYCNDTAVVYQDFLTLASLPKRKQMKAWNKLVAYRKTTRRVRK